MTTTTAIPTVELDRIPMDALLVMKEQEPQAFAIDSLERLAWLGRKRAGIQADIALVQRQAAEIVKGLEKQLTNLDERFMPEAEAFVRLTLQATGSKSKTLKTLGGSFSLRVVPGGYRKRDSAALLAWAKDNAPALVVTKTTEDVPADAVKTWIEDQAKANGGEVTMPPGIELAQDRESFSHKTEA